MFTVKYVGCDGEERIYQCEKIKVVQGKGRYEDGIFLDPSDLVCADTPAGFKDVIHFDSGDSSDGPSFTYVMNDKGSTVARYEMSVRGQGMAAQAAMLAA